MNRIKELRLLKNLTQSDLAEAIGVKTAYISKLENSQREIRGAWLIKLTEALDCSADQLLGISDTTNRNSATILPLDGRIQVIASVQAGHWAEAFELPEDDRTFIYYPGAELDPNTHFAVRVNGESMNKHYPSGSILICRDAHSLGPDKFIKNGSRVVVEQIRRGEHEATVKEIQINEETRQAVLMPKSTNPEYQSPIIIPWPYLGEPDPKTGIEEIRIKGLVVASMSLED